MKSDDLCFVRYEEGDEEAIFLYIETALYWTLPGLSFERASQRAIEQGATPAQIEYVLDRLTHPDYIPHRMVLR